MINYQDRAASDDAARAAAQAAPSTPSEPPTTLERMVDLFCENAARNLPTTDRDLARDGFTDEEIAELLPQARRLATERMTMRIDQNAA